MTQLTILCGDPQAQTRRLLQIGLEGYGYRVITADSGMATLTLAAQKSPDIVILNTDFGSEPDGIEVCQRVREWSSTPILFLSENREKVIKLTALNQGADDYVTKPFDMEELEARIRALIRRAAVKGGGIPDTEICTGKLAVNLAKRQVLSGGKHIHLTPTEYNILRLLVINSGKVITYNDLLNQVWHNDPSTSVHSVRVYINMLRKKLDDNRQNPLYIFTEPGIGYRFIDIAK